jgi:hypothetical protein
MLALVAAATAVDAQTNNWISLVSGNWDVATNWSAGLPNSNQFEVRITNLSSKAVAIQPGTPINSSNTMTVRNLRVGGVPPGTNLLLLNYSGTAIPLRVLHDFNIEPNGRVLMLYSGMSVSNALNLNGVFDQEGGELDFTNTSGTTMQIEGGQLNLTNAVVTGANLYLGGTNNGSVNQDSGVVNLNWLGLGTKPSVPGSTGNGTYILRNGWLIVSVHEDVGANGFGTLTQNGGTNSTADMSVGNGTYVKNGGSLFAGGVLVDAPSLSISAPPTAILTHAGGTATITNDLSIIGQGNRLNPKLATVNMFGGSLSAYRILMEVAGAFYQTNGTVTLENELFIDDNGGTLASTYNFSGGSLFTPETTVESSYPQTSSLNQSGGRQIVTNTLWINGTALYQLSGGTLTASNIVLTGNINLPPQFSIINAPSFTVTNQYIALTGGSIVIQNSSQQFGHLTMTSDSGINLAGTSAILRFADSHTNSWQSQLQGVVPRLSVYNWNGATNGGGTDQLVFGVSSSSLTTTQLTQIRFVNPGGFSSGTYPARILATGEVVPTPLPVLGAQRNKTNVVLSWSGNFILQSATNVVGPYTDFTNAPSPYSVPTGQFPMRFFRLRD